MEKHDNLNNSNLIEKTIISTINNNENVSIINSPNKNKQKVLKPLNEQDIKWQTLASYLERNGAPVGELNLEVTILGIYSPPEEWGKLEASGSVDTWQWKVKLSDVEINQGKYNLKELSEEEKKDIENKKKPKQTGKSKVEELTNEEREKMLKDQLEKAEMERTFKEKYEKADELNKFYMMKERSTNDSWINFPLNNINSEKKTGDKLLQLEEEINEDKKLFVEVLKIPPLDEDPKKRPKPKGISQDDVKPVICCGIIDVSRFNKEPGLKEIEVRTNLMLQDTYEKRIKYNELKNKEDKLNIAEDKDITNYNKNDNQSILTNQNKKDSKVNLQLKESNKNNLKSITSKDNLINMNKDSNTNNIENLKQAMEEDYVEKNKTYIHLLIKFDKPLNPLPPDNPLPLIKDLIKKEEKKYKPISADEVCNDFRKQLKIAIEAINKEYLNHVGDGKGTTKKDNKYLKQGQNRNDKANERDNTITSFLYQFNNTKKADFLKEKLKRFIVRIVREKWAKKDKISGVFKDNRDQFYTELFAYLCEEIKYAMDDFVATKKDDLHENITTSYYQSREEVKLYAKQLSNESEDKRLIRLSKEYEIIGDFNKALSYYKSSLTLNKNNESWLNYAKLNKKLGNLTMMEESIIYCLNEINLKQDLFTLANNSPNNNNTVNKTPGFGNLVPSEVNNSPNINYNNLQPSLNTKSMYVNNNPSVNNPVNSSNNNLNIQNTVNSKYAYSSTANKIPENEMNIYLVFACIKYLKNNIDYSINFMNKIINEKELKNTNACFNALLAYFYYIKSNKNLENNMFKKHKEAFKRFLIKDLPLGSPFKPYPGQSKLVNDEFLEPIIEMSIMIYVEKLFNIYNLFEISNGLMELFIPNKSSSKYLLIMAKINLERQNYNEVIKACNIVIEKELVSIKENSSSNNSYLKVQAKEEEFMQQQLLIAEKEKKNKLKESKKLLSKIKDEENPAINTPFIQKDSTIYSETYSMSEPYELRGHAYFLTNNLFNSAEDYVKAIRKKKEKENKFDILMLYRLGITFIRRHTWDDARTVFLEIIRQDNENYNNGTSKLVILIYF